MEASSDAAVTAANKPSAASGGDDRYYSFQQDKLEILQQDKPWMKDPKHFTRVSVSPSAIMKMMMHCASGVEKGIAQGGNPIEVMGLLLGRPDTQQSGALIVTDAFPLPIEGFETRVIADDQAVVNHMIALNESLEKSRKEKFMGWYHSHPFDLGDHSHCFLSQTDLSTQLQWQRAEDPHGNPFLAMVLDPLRTTHLGTPEIKAFRAYPPEYTSPVGNECPDGSIQAIEQLRLEHWGSCWNRYYELNVDYYMSRTSRQVLESLTQNYLWMTALKRDEEDQKVQSLQQIASSLATTPSSTSSAATAAATARQPIPADTASTVSSESLQMRSVTLVPGEWQSAVPKLSKVATQELSQATLRQVQQQVFPKSG